MSKKLKILAPLLVIGIGVILAAVIVRARPKVERREVAILPPLVRVVEVERRDVALDVRAQGEVRPKTESALVAQVAGRITSTSPRFAEGAFFRRGEVLVSIDARDFELAVRQGEARVAQAQVRLELERAEADLARQDWEELGEGEPTSLTLRQPQLAEARAGLAGAEAALEQARINLERTAIRAPFDSRVSEKRVDVGQYATPGAVLAALYSTAAAEIRLPVPKSELGFLDLDLVSGDLGASGPEVRLTGELGGKLEGWSGRVVRTGGAFDSRTRMLPLFVEVQDPFARRPGADRAPLPMGLFVDAAIAGRLASNVVVLPRSALRQGDSVLVVDGESRLRFRAVDVLRERGEEVIVSSGLDDGEQVCVSPLETVVDGMQVRTRLADPDEAPIATPEEGA